MARTKRPQKTRSSEEFDLAALPSTPPRGGPDVYSWTLGEIMRARDEQMRGKFKLAARLAESMKTDSALFTAYRTRLAPQRCIGVELRPAAKGRGESIAREAGAVYGIGGYALRPETLVDVHGCLADHGVAFTYNDPIVRSDGSRVDLVVRSWPIEWVRWDPYDRAFKTQTLSGVEETIVHGDGHWTIFRERDVEPFKLGAIVPGSLVWGRHAYGARDWAKGSRAHGNAKVVGELPPGVPLRGSDGALTPEAGAFIELLRAMMDSDLPAGIRPAGAKTEFVANTSTAWQVFKELVDNASRWASRVYLGTDGTMGAAGGAPGVDITALLGVATTLVQGDFGALERGIFEGILQPWTAINFGDSTLCPSRRYLLKDEDADAERSAYADRLDRFLAILERMRALFPLTQDFVDSLAARFDVDAPSLALVAPAATTPPAAASASVRLAV